MLRESMELVSVIIPIYNAEKYLPACINSVLAQSYQKIEVILVDDGSTDSSSTICDEYAKRDARVKVVHQTNGGIACAQNTGLDAAQGEYIAFADNDDILDSRNVELLMQALVRTGADMSKARWRQFGPSLMDQVKREAGLGANNPRSVTVFSNPLAAYQNIFCKSMRMLEDLAGRYGEARYLNEANWCRLYRARLWTNIRFPEGKYAQDTAVAGRLYSRMSRVADINVNLYNWLQRSDSVTHRQQKPGFYHDHVQAALDNMAICHKRGVTPARSYYTLIGNLRYERTTSEIYPDPEAKNRLAEDEYRAIKVLQDLSLTQHLYCRTLSDIRTLEKVIYDKFIKNMV